MRGEGKPGYCKVCAWHKPQELGMLNAGIRKGWKSGQAIRFAAKHDFTFLRQTFYKHKPHALNPEQRVIQASEQGRKALAIKSTSSVGFLEALRDIGFTKAIDDPDAVSIDHAIKAVSILEGRKDKGGDQINILVAISTGHPPPMVIEGTATEVIQE